MILFSFTLGNGSVDFDEFLTMMRCRRSTGESDTELYQVFRVNLLKYHFNYLINIFPLGF